MMWSRRRRRSAIADLDADRALALTYVPAARREALRTLWQLDSALGAVLAGGREPMISRIKLVWWRDSLAKLDSAKAPAEPVLQALAAQVLPAVNGAALSEMEEGWATLLSQDPLTAAELDSYAAARGALLFRYSAALLGAPLPPELEREGEVWALADLARNSNEADAGAAREAGRARPGPPLRWPAPLRPLGMLAALARRDLERGGGLEEPGAPGRMLRMLRHRITGR